MAVINCEFSSNVLQKDTAMQVILPEGARALTTDGKLPVLWLLHGLSDNETAWMRRTSIERYVLPLGIAVVMPDGGRGFYTDMANGFKYFTFMTEELPEIARSFFNLSGLREYNYTAGLSMGGYGAFLLALSKPEQYCAAASLSGALDMAALGETITEYKKEFKNIFGDLKKIKGSRSDLLHLAGELADKKAKIPALYACCGTEDFLYDANVKFRDFCRGKKIPLTYEEGPGDHNWAYWDENIKKVLEWLPIPGAEEKAG